MTREGRSELPARSRSFDPFYVYPDGSQDYYPPDFDFENTNHPFTLACMDWTPNHVCPDICYGCSWGENDPIHRRPE